MARVGTVDVAVRAKTSDFRKGLQRAQSRLQSFGRAVSRIGGRLKRFGGIASGVSIICDRRDMAFNTKTSRTRKP